MEMSEQEWWDIYGEIQDRVWLYDEYLEKVVRSEYLNEMENFLFKPEGHVLDIGCGSGWVGLHLAEKGMHLDGLDVSIEQIERANEKVKERGLNNARFFQGGIDIIETLPKYDGVIVHALFHHLCLDEKKSLLNNINHSLCEGGKVYFYEPVASKSNPDVISKFLDKIIIYMLGGLRCLVYCLHLHEIEIRDAIDSGWTMQSPEEAPIDIDNFRSMLPANLTVIQVRYWHMCTTAYASLCMSMKPSWRRFIEKGVIFCRWLDNLILRSRYRESMHAWPMASIMVVKSDTIE
jgi:SAM-dependent methyltransferase